MQQPNTNNSLTSLPLQRLIDARHDVLPQRNLANRGRSDFPGPRLSPRRGQGLEFVDLRQYTSGDDIRHIDWNVTARSNEPYTRLYREEREHTTTVAVDLRPCMFSGSDSLRAVRAGQLAASVLWQACKASDRCAAVVVSQRGQRFSRPLAGQRGVLNACELIASEFVDSCNAAKQNHTTNESQLSALLNTINAPTRQAGSYFIFSGFDTSHDRQWDRQLPVTGITGRMIAILILDPLETHGLPVGTYQYKTQRRNATSTISPANSKQFNDTLQANINQQKQQFQQAAIPLLSCETTSSPSDLLTELQRRSLL